MRLILYRLGYILLLIVSASPVRAVPPDDPENLRELPVSISDEFRLSILQQPSLGTTQQILAPFEIEIRDQSGRLFIPTDTAFANRIRDFRIDVWLGANTGEGVLFGKHQINQSNIVNGKITFNNLKVNKPGTYRLIIEGKYRENINNQLVNKILDRFESNALYVSGEPNAMPSQINYDIVYVRYPRKGDETTVAFQDGEGPYRMELGADLMLLHPDRSEEVLVDCSSTSTCSAFDPMISYDGNWVLYSKLINANTAKEFHRQTGDVFIFKMNLQTRQEIQLTGRPSSSAGNGLFFDKYAGYSQTDMDSFLGTIGTRDFAPQWLPNCKIIFASNRSGIVIGEQGGADVADVEGSLSQQLHTIDDHNGGEINKNLTLVGFSQLAHIQHPIVLSDGRLLYTNWDMAGLRERYGITTLYTSAPDGSDIRQFFEPHHRHKAVDHWITELSSRQIISTRYYPGSATFGFGDLLRSALDINGKEYIVNSNLSQTEERRYFSRAGIKVFTPHTDPNDGAAKDTSGRYSHPAAAPGDSLLVSYSPGPVVGRGLDQPLAQTPRITAGIYFIPNAGSSIINSPDQLIEVINTPRYNSIQPRPVVPYSAIFPSLAGGKPPSSVPADNGLGPTRADLSGAAAELAAYIGTSSIQNRETTAIGGDVFNGSHGKDTGSVAWKIQGTDVGKVRPTDIFGVRIIGITPYHYMKPYNLNNRIERDLDLLPDVRADRHVKGSFSHQTEKYKILGEWNLSLDGNNQSISGSADTIAGQQLADSSFLAKVPANTTLLIQAVDEYGMTLFTEQTWRHLKPGEVRADCGGCHAHSTETPSISFANKKANKTTYKPWDFVSDTPYIKRDSAGNKTVGLRGKGMWDIEFLRDIRPILSQKCFSCHTSAGNAAPQATIQNENGNYNSRLSLWDSTLSCQNPSSNLSNEDCYVAAIRPYLALAKDNSGKYTYADNGGKIPPPAGVGSYQFPNESRYARMLQARRSLLTWKIYGQRMDGYLNSDFGAGSNEDIDFVSGTCPAPSVLNAEEKGLITRWIDLGSPLDFSYRPRQRYTDDNLLPILSASLSNSGGSLKLDVKARDLESGINLSRLETTLDKKDGNGAQAVTGLSLTQANGTASGSFTLSAAANQPASVGVRVWDNAGNSEYRTLSWP